MIAKIGTTWPANIHAARARKPGLLPDTDLGSIMGVFLSENPYVVQPSLR